MTGDAFHAVDVDRLRSGHGVKWGSLPPGTLGAWVADMDFGVPPAVRESILRVTERQDFGYPFWPDGDPVTEAFEDRMATRHGWRPEPGRTRVFTDLIQILQVMIEHATRPGDAVAIHVPTYPPFLASILRSGRRVVPLPMRRRESGWDFDGEGLADRLRAQGCRMLVLVNPHNPTGRVFTRAELAPLAEVAAELDLVVLADEIHADLAFRPARHIPFASLNDDAAARTITTTSATKAFNIAGLRCAVAHVGAERVHRSLAEAPLDYFGTPSTLSRVATVAAWREGDAWLAELMRTLDHNRSLVARWAAALPWDLRYHSPEATYLSWFDFTDTPIGAAAPAEHLLRKARVLLSEGAEFAQGTDVDCAPFARLNFATSPSLLREVLARVADL
ncbi:aminotransferase class I/II-fold pyridoxal phosphate-dependent enzyme [Nonomuraea glycinis]|uniref:cysteine-S-conjugate beta-lyase n=1 Tax=Nonomuraea glycinis TaxID=2047744 RepID=A0A918A3Z0_9ACTN|nr:aminotransferase class I/II-fold pyridoxal phosphate-dependent enzyme [Nonomuraea glycinis]MCA2177782.1 aminotransferase class I/II-fold pyridoxal phosphate-dependent enzyme [Nonomuraea glycinis]GGP06690.1 aminotransferase [Nonomuraea glycinis]